MTIKNIYMAKVSAGAGDGTSESDPYGDTLTDWNSLISDWASNISHVRIQQDTYVNMPSVSLVNSLASSAERNEFESVSAVDWSSGNYQSTFDYGGATLSGLELKSDFTNIFGIHFTDMNGIGLSVPTNGLGDFSLIANCKVTQCLLNGFNVGALGFGTIINCEAIDCAGCGIAGLKSTTVALCKVIGSTYDGITFGTGTGSKVYDSIVCDNGRYGINVNGYSGSVRGNVIDGNVTGVYIDPGYGLGDLSWNKITYNLGYGIAFGNSVSAIVYQDHNFFYQNTSGEINYNGTATAGENNVSMSSDGYVDRAGGNFSTVVGHESVGISQKIGNLSEADNVGYFTGQFPPEYSSSGGGRQPRLMTNGA